MKRRAHRLSRNAALTALAVLAAGEAAAQPAEGFRPGTWEGLLQIGLGLDRERLQASDGSENTSFSRRQNRERLTVGNQGFYYLDPQLLTGSLALTFEFVRQLEDNDGRSDARNARFVGYAFDTSVFSGLPYNGRLFANRNQSFLTQPFGRTDLTFVNAGAAVRLREDSPLRDWGVPFFSASLQAEEQRLSETTTSVLGQSFRRDERQKNLGFEGHKGFETADLDVRYQYEELNDLASPQLNFRGHTATVDYSVDFGALLNDRSDTRLFYYSREGLSPIRLFAGNEMLRVTHAQDLFTTLRYQFARSDTQAVTTTTQSGSVGVHYQPYRNLLGDALLSASHQDLSTGTRDTRAGRLAIQYSLRLPGRGTFTTRAAGSYQVDDNRLRLERIDVTDEVQTAPSPLGAGAGFTLAQEFVLTATIVVVDTRGGARLPTTPGFDYDVVVDGNQTRIVPLPTSAVIQAGDPLAVSYTYQVNPSVKYNTRTSSFGIGIGFPWISFSIAHDQSDQTLLSGTDSGFLGSLRRDTAQLDLQGGWRIYTAQAGATYTRYDATHLQYRQRQLRATASARPSAAYTTALSAARTVTDFTLPEHRTDESSVHLSFDAFPARRDSSVWTTVLVGRRLYKDSLQPAESINEASLRSRLTYGMLDLGSAITASERKRAGFRTTNFAAEVTATRRF